MRSSRLPSPLGEGVSMLFSIPFSIISSRPPEATITRKVSTEGSTAELRRAEPGLTVLLEPRTELLRTPSLLFRPWSGLRGGILQVQLVRPPAANFYKSTPERRRQGKFQPLRRLFGKKKKREAKRSLDGAELRVSFSTGEVCGGVVSDNEESNKTLRELNPIGSRALSHDSIFIPEEPPKELGQNHSMSQENVSDKVRNLQRQIAQGIKFGQRPPSLRKSEGDEDSSDEEEVPQSPLKVVAHIEPEPPKTELKVPGAQPSGQHSSPVKSQRSRRVSPPTGTIESINLDAIPQSGPRLDNTAAKHKLSVKPKNQRVSRKHKRFTQDLQEVSISGVVQEDLEAAAVFSDNQRRTSVEDTRENLKKQRLYEEERQEARRRREMEEQRLREEEEERMRGAEELEEERKQQEERERRMREEAERRRREEEEEKRIREEEERRIREEEERRRREEEERTRKVEEEKRKREELRRQREEEERRQLEEQKRREEEERKRREEEEAARKQLELEAEKRKKQKEEEERRKQEEAEKLRLQVMEEKKRKEEEQRRMSLDEADGSSDAQEKKRRAEELRWKEMEERQRPFSFKVSSGEKQILFQKVNLTPVTPTHSHQSAAAAADQREAAKASSPEGPDSPNLPTFPYVPHTAILVTGAQLCGTAVNLDQIKDNACKSLLGLGEDKKAQGSLSTKSKTSPDRKSGKTKSLNESALSTDQSGAAVLAEWASIRSKIFKGVEDGKYEEYPDPPSRNQPQLDSEEQQPSFAHANLRKTMSASAKFSITPAKKKFGDSNRSSEVFGPDNKDAGEEATRSDSPTAASPSPTIKPQSRTSKSVRIVERGSEECMFAKDLPSFLVPSPGDRPDGLELKSRAQSKSESSESKEEGEEQGQDGEEKPSPFGIKLRRTNYSLRFHSEQSAEKRKKRYSAGDSFDGVPSPLTPIEPDSDASSVFSDKSSPTSPQKEGVASKYSHASSTPAVTRGKMAKSTSPTAYSEGDKVLSKPPLYRRPPTSPKPGVVPTPPPSPLPKVVHGLPCDDVVQRTGSAETCVQEQAGRSEEPTAVAQLHRSQVQGEEEPKEKRSFFPSINIPWREKADRKTELIKREKPSLQTRHSLDSAKVQEKEAGPLWITLALQKQKGFREQQQNREDRRSQREAKLAEKQARERDSVALVSPTESKGSGSSSPSSKPQTPEEPKRPDSLLGRFERREHLKKANTLPSSVTVEISDSTPSPPAVKDVSKRFPSSDSPQVSTEPAWLALAKRKAKAWSDCPQIIK
ncbi:capping protein inhibiting regulator of actin dynamics isoform X2 [Kryptolebias marmoratus]|uniref:capping protein inhibiting regulator of actin dynamics isoform X2 n=1 Tax=Kryptolebias marmoratus TaxID=37003 RepID=UPI0007F91A23|nr:capping protein inhibiting regulator of actin dynamics isoform X2 [Kryptolebias marmoratus]